MLAPRVTPDEVRSIAANHITSTNLNRVGYQGSTLYVAFKSGAVYQYEKVPYILFAALLAAESAGKFFNAKIRNAYAYKLLMLDPFDQAAT